MSKKQKDYRVAVKGAPPRGTYKGGGGGGATGRKERRALEILKRRPELSDRKIAKESGASVEFVRQAREAA
jgi:hypothetical protein